MLIKLRSRFKVADTGQHVKIVDDYETETVRVLIEVDTGHFKVHMSGLTVEQAHHELAKLTGSGWTDGPGEATAGLGWVKEW